MGYIAQCCIQLESLLRETFANRWPTPALKPLAGIDLWLFSRHGNVSNSTIDVASVDDCADPAMPQSNRFSRNNSCLRVTEQGAPANVCLCGAALRPLLCAVGGAGWPPRTPSRALRALQRVWERTVNDPGRLSLPDNVR